MVLKLQPAFESLGELVKTQLVDSVGLGPGLGVCIFHMSADGGGDAAGGDLGTTWRTTALSLLLDHRAPASPCWSWLQGDSRSAKPLRIEPCALRASMLSWECLRPTPTPIRGNVFVSVALSPTPGESQQGAGTP